MKSGAKKSWKLVGGIILIILVLVSAILLYNNYLKKESISGNAVITGQLTLQGASCGGISSCTYLNQAGLSKLQRRLLCQSYSNSGCLWVSTWPRPGSCQGGLDCTRISLQNKCNLTGCSWGTCKDTDVNTTYSHGINPFLNGTVIITNSSGTFYYNDSCVSTQPRLTEYYCSKNVIKNSTATCPDNYACINGACINMSSKAKGSRQCGPFGSALISGSCTCQSSDGSQTSLWGNDCYTQYQSGNQICFESLDSNCCRVGSVRLTPLFCSITIRQGPVAGTPVIIPSGTQEGTGGSGPYDVVVAPQQVYSCFWNPHYTAPAGCGLQGDLPCGLVSC